MGAWLLALAKSTYIISKATKRANYFNIRECNLSFAGNHGTMANWKSKPNHSPPLTVAGSWRVLREERG